MDIRGAAAVAVGADQDMLSDLEVFLMEHDASTKQIGSGWEEAGAAPVAAGGGFNWSPCTYSLLKESGEPWPRAAPPSPAAAIRLSVAMDKPPLVLEQGGWAWHKNCVLPRLRVMCEGGGIDDAACLLSAVRIDVLANAAHDAGLEGDTLRPLVSGACCFGPLSFKTTSYNLHKKPLHLMASLLLRTPNGSLGVACTLLSPPITVDARKRQAKSRVTAKERSDQNGGSSADLAVAKANGTAESTPSLLPFAPDLLERKLEKVEKDAAHQPSPASIVGDQPSTPSEVRRIRKQIDNSMDGLRAYLSALNIRNKCKHPLFLVLRFDTCVGLLYDSTSVSDPLADDETFYWMMECLGSEDPTLQLAPRSLATGEVQPPFIIAAKTYHEAHACGRIGCPVQLTSTLSLPHASTLPPAYKILCNLQIAELRRTYCRLYCKHSQKLIGSAMCKPQPKPALTICDSCNVPHAMNDPTPPRDSDVASAQNHASHLLSSVRQFLPPPPTVDADGIEACPEREWEYGLRVLAEAMSQHCHTRTAAEIIGFMQFEEVGAAKRMASASKHHDRGSGSLSFDHDHAQAMDAYQSGDAASGFTAVHEHDHSLFRG